MTAADWVMVSVNWLLLGALLVPLRMLFPRVLLFRYAMGAPLTLLGIAVLHAALITLVGYTERAYAPGLGLRRQGQVLGKSTFLATVVLAVGFGLQGSAWTTSILFACAGALNYGALMTWRWQSARQQRDQGRSDSRNVLIVGAGRTGRSMAAYLETHPGDGRSVYGFLDNDRPLGGGVIGRVEDLARLARTGFVDEVVLAAPHDREMTLAVLREARRLRLDVEIVPELFGCAIAGDEVDRVAGLPVISLHVERLPAVGLVLKRLLDVAGSGLALTVLAPLLAAIALAVKLESAGPVLYRAQRAGRKGRLFRCYKFRTMVSNADDLKDQLRSHNERSGPIFKIATDPRITRLGHILRRYSLDELPQLWNVLKGDMSLVGPRPHPADDYAAYEIEHLARLDVIPGITGLWQVTARRDPSFQRGMELDREYIRTWSLGSDIRILAKTVLAVVRGSGQ
jgi:exopolysaccharide biosynthesis polyprenyl glycosylphosphotransferase